VAVAKGHHRRGAGIGAGGVVGHRRGAGIGVARASVRAAL
jgi:hypothetical protein